MSVHPAPEELLVREHNVEDSCLRALATANAALGDRPVRRPASLQSEQDDHGNIYTLTPHPLHGLSEYSG
jgi:hypothetical protein